MYRLLLHTLITSIIYSLSTTFLIAQDSDKKILTDETYIELIKDINPGYSGSDLHNIINVNGIAYFVAFESSNGLWKSDGTSEGTQLIIDLDDPDIDFNYDEFTVFKDQLFFRAVDTKSGLGSELWTTDGSIYDCFTQCALCKFRG